VGRIRFLLSGVVALAGCAAFGSSSEDDTTPPPRPDTDGGGADATIAVDGSATDANADGSGSADAGPEAGPPKRVFVTTAQFIGTNEAGRFGACAAAATSASLGGTWTPWLSTDNLDARDALKGNGPWVTLKGNVVAKDRASLLDGTLDHAIDVNELLGDVTQTIVWTDTNVDGTRRVESTCSGPLANTGNGHFGVAGASNGEWTNKQASKCANTLAAIYCFED
jgi:hypothetical protein